METEREIGKRLYQIGGRWRDKRDCNARADAVACGTAVSAVASGPPAGLLWLPALVASELDGSEDPQDPLCRN